MLHEPLKKTGFETLFNFSCLKDGFFETTEIQNGFFGDNLLE